MNTGDEFRWETEKNRRLEEFSIPPIQLGEDDVGQDPLLFFHTKSEELRVNTGKIFGALHFKPTKELSSQIRLEPLHLTYFNRTVGYKWTAIKKDEEQCVAIFLNEGKASGPEHLKDGNLQQSSGDFDLVNARLSPESTLEQLDNLILQCGRNDKEVHIGIEGDICGVDNLRPLQKFNIYSIGDYITHLDSKKYRNLHGVAYPYAISGRKESVTPIHVEDHETMSMNMMILPGVKLWIIVGPSAEDINRLVTSVAPSTEEMCPRWYQDKLHMVTVKFLVDHNINFNIILQTENDIIVTHPHGFHQILNVTDCVNVARNIITVIENYYTWDRTKWRITTISYDTYCLMWQKRSAFENTPQCVKKPMYACSCKRVGKKKLKHDPAAACGFTLDYHDYHQWTQKYLTESQQTEKQKTTKESKKRSLQAGKTNACEPLQKKDRSQGFYCNLCGPVKSRRHDDFHKKMNACKRMIEKGGRLDNGKLAEGSSTCPICPIKQLDCDEDRRDHLTSKMHLRAIVLMQNHIFNSKRPLRTDLNESRSEGSGGQRRI